jgi:adenylate cyclase
LRSVFQGFALGLTLAVAGMLAFASDLGAELEEGVGLGWLFNARGPVAPPSEVIIVAIDEQSARQLGLPDKPRDWPRNLHAQLVRFLARAGARIVCFDLTFDRPGTDSAADEAFAAAVGAAGNVLTTDPLRTQTIWLRDANARALGSANIEMTSPPIAALGRARQRSGLANTGVASRLIETKVQQPL